MRFALVSLLWIPERILVWLNEISYGDFSLERHLVWLFTKYRCGEISLQRNLFELSWKYRRIIVSKAMAIRARFRGDIGEISLEQSAIFNDYRLHYFFTILYMIINGRRKSLALLASVFRALCTWSGPFSLLCYGFWWSAWKTMLIGLFLSLWKSFAHVKGWLLSKTLPLHWYCDSWGTIAILLQ